MLVAVLARLKMVSKLHNFEVWLARNLHSFILCIQTTQVGMPASVPTYTYYYLFSKELCKVLDNMVVSLTLITNLRENSAVCNSDLLSDVNSSSVGKSCENERWQSYAI